MHAIIELTSTMQPVTLGTLDCKTGLGRDGRPAWQAPEARHVASDQGLVSHRFTVTSEGALGPPAGGRLVLVHITGQARVTGHDGLPGKPAFVFLAFILPLISLAALLLPVFERVLAPACGSQLRTPRWPTRAPAAPPARPPGPPSGCRKVVVRVLGPKGTLLQT